jgi:hypothetical protein
MNILEAIVGAQDGAAVRQLGDRFGLDQAQAASAVAALVPALAGGVQRNIQGDGGLGSLLGALASGGHQRYLEDPGNLLDPGAVQDGNGILGHVLGSKDVSRQVASQAAAQTGISPDLLKQMLPLVATMVMGALARQQGGAASSMGGMLTRGAGAGAAGGLAGGLGALLDRDGDGSIGDDVAGMLGRFLRG